VSAFFAQWVGADGVAAAVEVAPVVEETIKILPLLYYLLVLEPNVYEGDAAAIFVSVGFATMESAFYLVGSGTESLTVLALRGLSAAMMHLTCGVIMGFGITHVWDRPWMKVSGTFGLLSLVIVLIGYIQRRRQYATVGRRH
jgi:RsiW-degrading membrane proteinase PrsW (M82 family)